MFASSLIVIFGLGIGWLFYGLRPVESAVSPDPLEAAQPIAMATLGNAFFIDALYGATILRLNVWFATLSDLADSYVWNGFVQAFSYFVVGLAWFDNFFDKYIVNAGFDAGCETVSFGGRTLSLLQRGRVQGYLRTIGLALIVLVVILLWGPRA
jgi:NADH-quinone oxidoreductase subunit L